MKTAVYIEDGIVQVVLTPECDFEKGAISSLADADEVRVFDGTFYDCRGGWTRQKDYHVPLSGVPVNSDQSLIIRVKSAAMKTHNEQSQDPLDDVL